MRKEIFMWSAGSWVLLLILCLFPSRAAGENVVRIGATVSETGHFATEVGPFGKLFRAWADDFNGREKSELEKDPFRIELTVFDDRS
jgi:hypothetical protein